METMAFIWIASSTKSVPDYLSLYSHDLQINNSRWIVFTGEPASSRDDEENISEEFL